MSYSTQQLRKTCTTHTQTQDWTIHFDWCSQSVTLLFTAKSTNTAQTYPSITLAAAYPKPKEVHYKIKLQRSNATKSTSRNLCPSPMATTYCHRSSQDHTRPDFLAPAFVIKFLTFKRQCCLFFVAQIRIATFWTITVCCYFRICVHVHTARLWGIVSWVLVGCCCTVFGT